jgi:hypothetical protein
MYDMSTAMVTEYMARELKAAGYDVADGRHSRDFDIQWSLSYCQGDGMSFQTNRMNLDECSVLLERLMSGQERAAARRAMEKLDATLKVTETRYGPGIPGMSAEFYCYGDYDELTDKEKAAFEAFEAAINEDVKSMERSLQRDGYKLLEACSPTWWHPDRHGKNSFIEGELSVVRHRTFNTDRLQVQVDLIEDDTYNPYEWGNGDQDHEDVKGLRDGETIVCAVRARIFALDEDGEVDMELAEETLWGVSDDKSMGYIKQVAREQVSECIAQAREKLAEINDMTSRFRR